MLNRQKSRSTVNAVAALAQVTHTPAGNPRQQLSRITQTQLQAVLTGREAVKRLEDVVADLRVEVSNAENLVIDALNGGAPVTDGLVTPAVVVKTKFARVSWKGATKTICERFGLSFTAEEAELKAAVEPNNTEYDTLVLK